MNQNDSALAHVFLEHAEGALLDHASIKKEWADELRARVARKEVNQKQAESAIAVVRSIIDNTSLRCHLPQHWDWVPSLPFQTVEPLVDLNLHWTTTRHYFEIIIFPDSQIGWFFRDYKSGKTASSDPLTNVEALPQEALNYLMGMDIFEKVKT